MEREKPSCPSQVQPTTNRPTDERHTSDLWQDRQQNCPAEPSSDGATVNKQNGDFQPLHLRWLIPQQWVTETKGSSSFSYPGCSDRNLKSHSLFLFPSHSTSNRHIHTLLGHRPLRHHLAPPPRFYSFPCCPHPTPRPAPVYLPTQESK